MNLYIGHITKQKQYFDNMKLCVKVKQIYEIETALQVF